MTVMELKTLPLGFRFHPTDEELIRHYLKGKITGQINSEVEVIPEIDVCKCEPWDLPDKSLIRSDDPEWFFFAPKDRKYPNGSRSNRATEAGYWKATGKDRQIKSKGDKRKQHIIGMKKTLVFHRGRAPKGERTGWIMHEYRTTEPEFDSGEQCFQGGYVLYRLFRKQEEKSERSSLEEMDRSGYSPTPSRSTPDNMEAKEEVNTPLNKESPESTLHESPIDLPSSVESHAIPTMCLTNTTDNLAANAVNVSQMPLHGHIDGVAKVDPSAGTLSQLIDPQKKHGDPSNFASGSAPILLHEGDAFFTDFQQGTIYFDGNMNPPYALDDFLNQTLADLDEHSSTTSKVQYDSDTGIVHTEFENHGIMQGELLDEQNWWEDLSFIPDEPNPQLSALYENTPLLPYDTTDQDVLSMDSGAESLHDLFNNMEDSSVKRDVWGNEPALQGTGITVMPRQLQSTMQSNCLFSHQGIAPRRLRLQLSDNVESGESITRDESEDEGSCIITPKYLNEFVEEAIAEKDAPSDGDEAESTGITIRSRGPAPNSSSDSPFAQQGTVMRRLRLQLDLNAGPYIDDSSSCIIDETKSQHKAEEAEIEEDASTNVAESVAQSCNSHDNVQKNMSAHDSKDAETAVPEVKSVPRLRKNPESGKDIKQEGGLDSLVRAPRQKGGFKAYIIWLVLSVSLLLLLCAGIYGWV